MDKYCSSSRRPGGRREGYDSLRREGGRAPWKRRHKSVCATATHVSCGNRYESGFSLVEVLVATLILTIGLVSMVQLLAVSTVMHSDARAATTATQYAQAKIDELAKLNLSTAAAVQITPPSPDSLTTNVANYFDSPQTRVTRRWRVQAGPSADTRTLTVRVINTGARQYGAQVTVTTIIRQW